MILGSNLTATSFCPHTSAPDKGRFVISVIGRVESRPRGRNRTVPKYYLNADGEKIPKICKWS